MRRLIGLLTLALLGCIPQTTQSPYRVSEIQLLFPDSSERWTYFYGEPQVVRLGGRALALEQRDLNNIWAIRGALSVNGEPALREVGPPVPTAAKTTRVGAGSQYVVQTGGEVQAAWAYDSSWTRLGDSFKANSREVVDSRLGSPMLGTSETESEVILREILARRGNRPVVIYQVAPVLPANTFDPAPTRYETMAIAVQYGLETETSVRGPQTPQTLLQGSRAAYTAVGPAAFLAANQAQFDSIWRTANGNQLPAPATPSVNFSSGRVVAFFWGQKPSGGYTVSLVGTQTVGNTLRVTLNLTSPRPGDITTQALTSPFIILSVPGAPTKVEFVDNTGQLLASAGG